jgi:GPI-anchor transamidase subunit S
LNVVRSDEVNAVDFGGKLRRNDEEADELVKNMVNVYGEEKVYSVVVVNGEEEVKAVVGKYRHGWIVGKVSEDEAVLRVAEIFGKVFVNGGSEDGSIRSEFMPVGSDGRIVLSFSLLNADPRDWVYDWYVWIVKFGFVELFVLFLFLGCKRCCFWNLCALCNCNL